MIKTYFKGLNDPKQRVATTRLDKMALKMQREELEIVQN